MDALQLALPAIVLSWLNASVTAVNTVIRMARAPIMFAFVMAALWACGEAPTTGNAVTTETVEDGVLVIENPVAVADARSWRIRERPVVVIGVAEGPVESIIGRLAGYARRSDGSFVVGDAASNELRLYDGSGHYVRTIGRRGQGPGEYLGLNDIVAHAADSMLIFDSEGMRVTVLDPDLRFVRRFMVNFRGSQAPQGVVSHQVKGLFAPGAWLMVDIKPVCSTQFRDGGFCEDSVAAFRTDVAGVTQASYGTFVNSRQQYVVIRRGILTGFSEPHARGHFAVHGDRFYFADGRRFAIYQYGNDGVLQRIIRVAHSSPRYDRETALWRPSRYQSTDLDRNAAEARERAEGSAILPDTFPAINELLVDSAGFLWVREYVPIKLHSKQPPRWFVIDTAGHLQYVVTSPSGLSNLREYYGPGRPTIGEDYVLADVRDEDGVESVALYRLEKKPR